MTYGNGATGCLGHGDYDDIRQPRIVESLLGIEVKALSAGSNHVMISAMSGEVFGWGCGDNGRLGLGDEPATFCLPQQVWKAIVGGPCCACDCFFSATKLPFFFYVSLKLSHMFALLSDVGPDRFGIWTGIMVN